MYAPTHPSPAEAVQPTEEQARAAADLLRLLADPTRLRLLAALTAADRDVTELTELTGVPRPGVSQHLSKLRLDRKSTRLNSSHANISYAVFCLKKKKN